MARIFYRYLWISLLVTFIGCNKDNKNVRNPVDFVPQDVSAVFKISDWNGFYSDVENNTFLSNYKKSTPLSYLKNYSHLFKNLHPQSESLFCIQNTGDSLSDFVFLTRLTPTVFQLDSIKNKTVEALKIGDLEMQRNTIENHTVFTSVMDSVFMVSSSQKLLMDILEEKVIKDDVFNKLYHIDTNDAYRVLLNDKSTKDHHALSSWTSVGINLSQESFSLRGISVSSDSIPLLLQVFDGQVPQANRVAEIAPANAQNLISITFNDSEKLQNNLHTYRKDTQKQKITGIFDSATEIGSIETPGGTAYFLTSLDPSVTNDALAKYSTSEQSYREVEIKKFSETNLFYNTFNPLLSKSDAVYVFEIDDFFVFVPTLKLAEEIIGAYQNNSTVVNKAHFTQLSNRINTASTLMKIVLDGSYPKFFHDLMDFNPNVSTNEIQLEEYPISILQYIQDRDFAHVSFNTEEFHGTAARISRGIVEKYTHSFKAPLLEVHQVFNNNGPQAIVQDAENTLYFISESGKILWQKELGNPILGSINYVDLFKNNNQQLAFVTKNRLYVLDRNGKDVRGFPVQFRDEVTQPLSVFDYDNNRNYRLAVVQSNNLLLYDGNGKLVRGFNFKKTKSSIVQPAYHFRLGNKDYIVVAEENGKLNILNRMGQTRIPVNHTFEFSEIPITTEDRNFVVITKDNIKKSISEKGVVTSVNLNVGANYWFTTLNNTKATLDDNLLRVNNNLIDLPLGVYSQPVLFSVSNKIYTAITELQEKRVYVFDPNNRLIDGFPIYGSSVPFIISRGHASEMYMAVKGETNEIIVYVF